MAWVDDIEVERDDAAGILRLVEPDDVFRSARWGPGGPSDWEDDVIKGQADGVRVVYDAGFDVIPADLQDAAIEGVKASLERKSTSGVIQTERTDTWTITQREFINSMPDSVVQVLALYRSHAR